MSLSRGTAFLAAFGIVAGALGVSSAQQSETPRRPNVQNEQPEQTPPRTPRTPRPSGTTPATPAQPGAPGEGATPATPAQPGRPVQQGEGGISGFVLASQVVGVAVQTEDGQQIGTISDLLLTTRLGFGTTTGTANTGNTNDTNATVTTDGTGLMGGTRVFAFISVEATATGRVAVIPWELLRYENGVFILAFDVSRLNDVPSVMLDDPRILENQEWLGQVNEFFADDLRQIQRARPDLDNVTPDAPATPDTLGPPTTRPGTTETPNPRTPNPRTPNPRSPNTETTPRQPGNTPAPAPRTSQPGAGTTPNP